MEKIAITGGKYRGRKILTPGGTTHPMGSRERLALFNMLTGKIDGARILDAFAGSGALGIEALSRGASSVVFIDKNRRATEVIRTNLAELEIESGVEIICGKISEVSEMIDDFDIILADPPYDNFDFAEVEGLTSLVEKEGILVLSHPGEAPEFDGLLLLKTRVYAAAHLSIYIKN